MRYKFVNTKDNRYVLYLQYVKGVLKSMEFEFLSLTKPSYDRLMIGIHPTDLQTTIDNLSRLSFYIHPDESTDQETKEKPTFNAVAAWCLAYKEKFNVEYTCTPSEAKQLRQIVKTESDIQFILFFLSFNDEWWSKTKTIKVFSDKFNEVRRLAVGKNTEPPKTPKSKYPADYSAAYEKTLNGDELVKYWQHLRAEGYSKIANGVWKRVNQTVGESMITDLANKFGV